MNRPPTRPPARSPSLRTRVALASALGTTLVLVALAVLVTVALTRSEYGRLDARLSVAATAAVADTTVNPDAAVTVRTPARVRVLAGPELPVLAPGMTTIRVNDTRYRVRTRTIGRTVVSVGEPVAITQSAVRSLQRTVAGVALGAVAVAAGLGWLFAGVAVRPLTRLARRTRELPGSQLPEGPHPRTRVHGAREVDQLAGEVDALLERVETARRDTATALQSARDFAATAAHELRTPLTAMRTDLEVLAANLVPEGDRPEVLSDLLRTQDRVNETLTALVGLATGEVADGSGRTSVDLTELVNRVAAEQARLHPGVQVSEWPGPPVPAVVLVTGLTLALTNLVTNAVRHGGATEIRLGARTVEGGVELVCDDDGCGIGETERTAVLARFARGSSATAPGSGLGLALVVQQAQLHGGGVLITDSPLGGTRVLLGWPAQPLIAA